MAEPRRPWYTVLYIQVLIAIALGVLIGYFFPSTGVALKPLGDGFISLIKMMIAPVIFCTVVHGIGSMRDLKKVGRVGIKTLFYFEAVSTIALALGLLVGDVLQPGKGFDIDPSTLDPKRSRATSIAPRRKASSPTCCRSVPRPSSAPSPRASCFRCCWSQS
jgi:aerobic C4-dicarboxylate transport protein